MDTFFAVGSVVWIRPRTPKYRFQSWLPHGCWPGVVRRFEDRTGYAWLYVVPCGSIEPGEEERLVMLDTMRDNIAAEPCLDCAAAWLMTGWQQLATATAGR